MIKTITIKKALSWNPCSIKYDTEEKLLKVTKGKTSLTPLEVSKLKIPYKDRIWILLRREILGENNYREISFKIADRAVKKHCLKCGIQEVEQWAKKWISGKDRSTVDAANAVANAVANAAASAATYAATYAVNAAANAANAVASAVANAVASAASATYTVNAAANTANAANAACVARVAERKWQLNLIKKYLR